MKYYPLNLAVLIVWYVVFGLNLYYNSSSLITTISAFIEELGGQQ